MTVAYKVTYRNYNTNQVHDKAYFKTFESAVNYVRKYVRDWCRKYSDVHETTLKNKSGSYVDAYKITAKENCGFDIEFKVDVIYIR